MLDIVSTRMLGQFGFLAKVISTFIMDLINCSSISNHQYEKFKMYLIIFLWQVFAIFEDLDISVDVVATSEVSISVTLDPSKIWSRELIKQAS